MPTPIEILLDPISIIAIGIYLFFILIELLFPARQLPQTRGWVWRSIIAFLSFFFLSSYLPLLTDEYLAAYQLLDLSGLSTIAGAFAALMSYQVGQYVWHRMMHKKRFLWRWFHQMHHSAERLDVLGAFYFSPLDIIGWTLLGSLMTVLVIGVSPEAATVFLLTSFGLACFQHMNVRTPVWLGYIIQRPESHSIHHKKGVHHYNYADIPILDIIFGTFKNPRQFTSETGFYEGGSSKVLPMMIGRDVWKAPVK